MIDAAEFEQLWAENRLRFPFWASVKLCRRPSKPRPEQLSVDVQQPSTPKAQQQNSDFDCFIVDASEQDMFATPSIRSTMLLPMLSDSTDNVLPATLEMVRKSDHAAMAVQYMTQQVLPELSKAASKLKVGVPLLRACSRVVALVVSTKRSKVSTAGAGGYKIVTDDVTSVDNQKKYSLTSFCTLDTVTDFKLDPQGRARSQAALISVTGVVDTETDSVEQPINMLLVDNVHLLTPQEVEALKPIFIKMFYFAALAGQISRKRDQEAWSPEVNPAKSGKCRVLGRSPTGPALPDYSSSSTL